MNTERAELENLVKEADRMLAEEFDNREALLPRALDLIVRIVKSSGILLQPKDPT